MGFFDSLGEAVKKTGEMARKFNDETYQWRDRLEGKSVEELRKIAASGTPHAKRRGACLLLKEMGYGE